MPADITIKDGKAEMAYSQGSGIEPWHGLGTRVPVDAMTAKEAMTASGMDWTVEKKPIFFQDGKVFKEVENKVAIVRSDSNEPFAVMSDSYTPVQNVDAFQFFDSIVGTTEAKYHTVGSLFGGRKIWLMVRLPEVLTLDNGQPLEQNIILSNSHDGSSRLRIDHSRVNVVCSNTLSFALSEARDDYAFKAKHTSGILNRVVEARELLGLVEASNEIFLRDCNNLIDTPFTNDQMNLLARDVWGQGHDAELKGLAKVAVEKLMHLFQDGTGTEGRSSFDAYMAVTEFEDHFRPVGRKLDSIYDVSDEAMSQRVASTWFGNGGRARDKAFNRLVAGGY